MRGRQDFAGVAELVYPLTFSLTGLTASGLALMVSSEDGRLALLRLVMVAAAPPIAAMVAVHFSGHAGEPYP
jgi:hypothetical protein